MLISFKPKVLLPATLLLTCLYGFSIKGFADDKRKIEGTTMTFKGNTFEIKQLPPPDSIYVEDPVTKEQHLMISKLDPMPLKVNGNTIYSASDVNKPALYGDNSIGEFKEDLTKKVSDAFEKLKDGDYNLYLSTLVVDHKGEIVYYSKPFITLPESFTNEDKEAVKPQIKVINAKVATVLDKFSSFSPAEKDGQKVPYYLTGSFNGPYLFRVKNHKATYIK